MKFICALPLLLLILCATIATSAQSTDATISGVVVDPSGKVIQDADIQILNEATSVQYSGKTNGSGIYTISILPPGKYRVQVSKIGFKSLIKPGIILNVQTALALNFTLPLGAFSETVTVDAGTSSINTTDASVSTVIDKKFVENMPLNGRSFQDLISMTPGVVTQSPQAESSIASNGDFSVNGQRTESNYYTVDGVTGNISPGSGGGIAGAATGGTLGSSTVLGTTQSLVSVDALQEFRVQSSTYSAEYGRSPGGQFSLVTRSGTNNLHGTAFDYLRNNFFDANDWFNGYYGKPTPGLRQNDFGGTFGGPIWIPGLYKGTGRSFFFASYEGLRLALPTAATIQYVPDTFMRQMAVPAIRGILNAYPVQNGLDYGSATNPSLAQFIMPFTSPSDVNATSIRFDHTISPKLSIFFRYGGTPSSTTSRSLFALANTRVNVQTYTLGATTQFSSRSNNEFRVGYDRGDSSQTQRLDSFGGATPIDLAEAMGIGSYPNAAPIMYFYIPGIGSSELATGPSQNRTRQWNLVDTFSTAVGHHQLKAGMDYRPIKSPIQPTDPELFIEFTSIGAILNNSPTYPYAYHYVAATPIFHDLALFLQDEWRATRNLEISLGIRWELNPPPHEQHGNDAYTLTGSIADPASLALAPQGTPLWKTAKFNFAPRIGLAWTARGVSGGETVVRAGGGVFFDNLNEVAALGYEGLGFVAHKLEIGATLPLTPAQVNVPISTESPYTSAAIYAFPKHLQLPYTLEWNVSLQQALGKPQSFTLSYVGANGRRLIGRQQLSLAALNPDFGTVYYLPSGITSNYQALQVLFQRTVTHGVHALASYTWSHSLDFGSSATELPLQRANSDFDVRQSLQGGLSWELPSLNEAPVAQAVLNDWGLDLRWNARTAFPVTLGGNSITDPSTGNVYPGGVDFVPGKPLYLYGHQYPGGRALNGGPLVTPGTAALMPATGTTEGNAPRNFARGFRASQINLAVRREFRLHDVLALQFRAEAFNLLNHPNFGYIDPELSDATFGQATKMLNSSLGTIASQYQQGGSRSMQFALKLVY